MQRVICGWTGAILLGFLVTVGSSAGERDERWEMLLHTASGTHVFTVSEIDSVTFRGVQIPAACCVGYACFLQTEDECMQAGGVFHPEWTSCAPNTCDPALPPGMVRVPAGTFLMGSPPDEPGRSSDETQHEVTLTRDLYVSVCEVTQSEWQSVMGWNESGFPGPSRPVERVTWFDAVSYCNQRSLSDGLTPVYTLTGVVYGGNHIMFATVTWNQAADGYRLLTESEWEYACRATSTTAFCNGGITNLYCDPLDPNLDQVGWYCSNASSQTHDVGGKTANAWGLQDMHGNVWEWCWDGYGTYPTGPVTDPIGPGSGFYPVIRGGSWHYSAEECRSARRQQTSSGDRYNELGFRLSRTAP